jgi:hypothetical protein
MQAIALSHHYYTGFVCAASFLCLKASPTPKFIARNERRALKKRLRTARKQAKMGFQRNLRRINMGPAQGKEKRGRPRKKPHPPAPAPTPAVMKRKSGKSVNTVDLGARVGASKQLPITVDSDDNDEEADVVWVFSIPAMARILTPPAVCEDPPMPHCSIQTWATLGTNPAPQQTHKTERDMCTLR